VLTVPSSPPFPSPTHQYHQDLPFLGTEESGTRRKTEDSGTRRKNQGKSKRSHNQMTKNKSHNQKTKNENQVSQQARNP